MPVLNIKLLEEQLQVTTKKIDVADTNIEINKIVENLVVTLMDTEFSSIWFYDEENALLLRERDTGLREISINEKRGILYKCFMTKEHGIYNYLTSEKEYITSIDNPDEIKIKSKIMLPLVSNDKLIGIVTAYTSVKKIKFFTEDDLELLKAIAPYIIDTICKMHPQAKIEVKAENCRRKQHSKRAEFEVVNKAKEIQESREDVESSDETLAFMSNTIQILTY